VKILQTFDWLNAEWLITGKGEMEKAESVANPDDLQQLTELIKYLREKDEKIEKLIEEKTAPETVVKSLIERVESLTENVNSLECSSIQKIIRF
jgi:polyhydroxyalkanoate synthesis regulator phasin